MLFSDADDFSALATQNSNSVYQFSRPLFLGLLAVMALIVLCMLVIAKTVSLP